MNLVLTCVCWVMRKLSYGVVSASTVSCGNCTQSLLVVIIVTVQLLVSVAVARAIILFLFLTAGGVEPNPGPDHDLLQPGPALPFYYSKLTNLILQMDIVRMTVCILYSCCDR